MKEFALVGCGRIAEKHAENITRVGKLVAVCDVVMEKADAFAARFNAKAYYSIDDLLSNEKGVEVVSVCTPNGFHAEHVIKSLQAKKHVICESPLCLTTAAAWQIIETEKFCRRRLFVVKSARYNPLLMELKNAISDGILGTLYSFHLSCIWHRPKEYYTDWRGKQFPDGGMLYSEFSHYIDAILWLFGKVDVVSGFRQNKAHQDRIEFEDTGIAALQMENGVLGALHWSVNAFQKNHEITLTIIAQKGTVRLGGEYLHEVQYAETASPLSFPKGYNRSNDQSLYSGPIYHHDELYMQLVQAGANDDTNLSNSFDGLRTVEAIEKIYKAIP
jgi:predicted dehydrogenase